MTSLVDISSHANSVSDRGAATWLHAISHLDPKYGGLSAAVPALGSAVSAGGQFSVALAGFCLDGEHYLPPVAPGVNVHYFPIGYRGWWRDRASRQTFRNLARESAGLHIHGLWQLSTSAAARAAQFESKPYIVSAHGMLESWALANKRLKKTAYAWLFERANLRSATCLHALTGAEARDYRNFGLRKPIAIIPNGVDVPAVSSSEPFLNRFPELRNKRLVLFLGRIHFKKGLDALCEAWTRVSRDWPDAQLVLAGPDFENTRASIEKLLEERRIRHRVTFTGMLGNELKWSALRAAECFVLPSYSEGLSVSVLEAMGMGLPVIVSEQCNLPEVAGHDCGWVIEPRGPGGNQLESALDEVLRASSQARAKWGANGRRLVSRRYSWRVVGEQMTALYTWAQGGGLPTTFEMESGAIA
jgi:glycosyltransferase involved in cell wall biosynthesis